MTLVWGANFSLIKVLFNDFLPLTFSGLRFSVASIAIAAIVYGSGRDLNIRREHVGQLFVLALTANTFYQVLFIIGASLTRAGNAALILATTPLFTAFWGWIRKQERLKRRGLVGLFLALAGISLIVFGSSKADATAGSLAGNALVLAATIFWSIYSVWSKEFLHEYGSTKTTAITMIMGTGPLLLICVPSFIHQPWAAVSASAWLGLLGSALFSIVLAYIIWNYGVSRIGSTKTAIYGNLTPVIAMLIAWPALGEIPAVLQMVGAAIVFLSIHLVRQGIVAVAPESVIEEEMEEASLGPGKN